MNAPLTPREILQARARELARPVVEPAPGAGLDVVEFRLASERYAIERAFTCGVQPFETFTPLPGAPAFLRGILNVRGQIVPLIDLRAFFELPPAGITDLHAVILVKHGDVEAGVLADAVTGVVSIPAATLQPALPTLTGIRADYLKGVMPGALVLLDAARMLSDERIVIRDDPAAHTDNSYEETMP